MGPRDIELQDMPFAEPEKPARRTWRFTTRHYIYAALGAFVLLVLALFTTSSKLREKVSDATKSIVHNGPFFGTVDENAPEGVITPPRSIIDLADR